MSLFSFRSRGRARGSVSAGRRGGVTAGRQRTRCRIDFVPVLVGANGGTERSEGIVDFVSDDGPVWKVEGGKSNWTVGMSVLSSPP